MKHWQTQRDIILFFGGIGGVVHETLLATAERPTLLILFAAMMGLPAFLQTNGNGNGRNGESSNSKRSEKDSEDGSGGDKK